MSRLWEPVTLVTACYLALGCFGCAAVFKGSTQPVSIDSVPNTAEVRINESYVGVTPHAAQVSRSSAPNIRVSKEGYADQTFQLHRQPDTPWFIWDIATCVIPIMLCVPLIADGLSGSWYTYEDQSYRVKLEPAGAGALPGTQPVEAPPTVPPGAPPAPPPEPPIETLTDI
jgi:hypothetical protein